MPGSTSSQVTRSSLLVRAKQKDSAAWHELVDLYGPLLAQWCRQCGLDSHNTADCIQDILASVSMALVTFTPEKTTGAFRAWLWTIARRRMVDHFRRSARNPAAIGGSTAMARLQDLEDPMTLPVDEPTSDVEIQALTQRALTQVQAEFEVRTWQAFWRTVVDGLSTAAAAQELAMSEASVRQARSRILRRLREQLGDFV